MSKESDYENVMYGLVGLRPSKPNPNTVKTPKTK